MGKGTARDAALDAQWLPHTYDISGSMLSSVFVPREARGELMFLSDEHFEDQYEKVTHPAAAIAACVDEAPEAPLHFIFHTAFCGSTLLVKALDIPGRSHGLKEPDVLINLGNRLIRADDAPNRERLRLVLRLLARPLGPGEMTVVKPSNIANRLAIPALEARPNSRAVLLYSDLRPLLRSILKRGMWGRIWGRRLFRSAASWTPLRFGYSEEETFVLTDLQALGLAWLMQVHHFGEIARRFGERVLVVDSGDFLADPAPTLGQVARLFGIDLDEQAVAAIVNGPVFARHSKFSDREYGSNERAADHSAAETAHHEELEMVVKWVEAVAAHLKVDLRPGATLAAN